MNKEYTNKIVKMVSANKYLIFLGIVVLFISSCKDFIEINLGDKNVTLLAPSDNIQTKLSTQTFWWDVLDGARSYNLQVVSTSFDSIEKVIVDTTVTTNKFTLNLFPGRFEWRVRALNGSSKTSYFASKIVIDSTSDLRSEKIKLDLPTDSLITNSQYIAFKWDKIYNALNYTIEIRTPDWNGKSVYSKTGVVYDTINRIKIGTGNFVWGVKGNNLNTSTDFTTSVFIIDTIPPGAPTLIAPANKIVIAQLSSDFSWSRAVDTGSKLSDSIIVSKDSLFSRTNVTKALIVNGLTTNISVPDTGTYYWRVKTFDAAGNQSPYPIQKFWRFTVHKN